ncbi:hypothetical protein ACFX2C_009021 [Malus domestica]
MPSKSSKKTTDLGMKARFQYIREARVLGFEVDPYTDIDVVDLPFSLQDLQYLRYHFEVFSAVSLFSLTAYEKERVAILDVYLDTRDARIAYQERTRKALQKQDQVPTLSELEVKTQNETSPTDMLHEHVVAAVEDDRASDAHEQDIWPENLEDEDHDPMGPSVIDNMEISMVHIYLQSSSQPHPNQIS